MSSSSDSPQDGMQVPRDSIALSRMILHLANLGTPRPRFLREVSRLLIEFSACDMLQVRCFSPELSYRWTLWAGPNERSCFESVDDHDAKDSLDCIAEALARSDIEPSTSCVTPEGSFWTGDAPDALAGFGAERLVTAGQCLESIRSILMIPFRIQEGERAYLLLGSRQREFFGHEVIERLETLAHTLAQAIVDRRSQAALRERVKELSCLYHISQIKAAPDQSFTQRLQAIIEQLPVAWQYPEDAVAQVILDDSSFSTGPFDATLFRQTAPIKVDGRTRGQVEVGYLRDRPEFVEGPFLPEEQSLIDAVARELSLFVEQVELGNRQAQLEEQLRHADRLAMIGTLASGIAHEINEPLESILGFAQLLEKQDLPENQRRDLSKIMSGGLHARDIVRKLLMFARQEPLKKGPVDITQVIRESVTLVEGRIAKAQVELHVALADDTPSIVADAVQLRQVVLNLIMNALQAMPRGGELKLTAHHRDKCVILAVEDTGVGMSDVVKEKMFSPFFTTKEVGDGTGLGLSVVHGIVAAHGGTIEVESELGRGARFEIRLPMARLADAERGKHGQ